MGTKNKCLICTYFYSQIGAVCRRFLSGPKQGIFCGLRKYLCYPECRGHNSAGKYLYRYETPIYWYETPVSS